MKRVLVIALLVIGCKSKGSPDMSLDQQKSDRGRGDTPPTTGLPGQGGSGAPIVGGNSKGGGIQLDLDGAIEVGAGIDKDVVRKVVKDNNTKLQYCYEKTLLANPGIEGKVVATFTIGTDGAVAEVKAAGVHPDVEACVADAVKAFKFPPSAGKVEVSYPFTFKPA